MEYVINTSSFQPELYNKHYMIKIQQSITKHIIFEYFTNLLIV